MIHALKIKYISIITLISFLPLLESFSQNIEYFTNKNSNEKSRIKASKIKSLTEWGYSYKFGEISKTGEVIRRTEYDRNGNQTDMMLYDSIGIITHEITNKYNSDDGLLESKICNPSRLLNKTTCRYDEKGYLAESFLYEYDGRLNHTVKYRYDDKNILREIIYFLPDLQIDEKIIFRYNNDNEKTERLEYSADGTIQFKTGYKYDSKGNRIEQLCYNRNGEIVEKISQKYDTSGNKFESAWYESNNIKIFFNVFKYDNRNNLIESSSFNGINEPEYLIKYVYEYFEK